MLQIILILSILFLSYSVPAHAMSPGDYCKKYAKFNQSEASNEYEKLFSLSKKLDLEVGNYIQAGTPQKDPDFSTAAKQLGDTIGKAYALCRCNESFSQGKNCQALIKQMKKSNLIKK